MPLHLRNAPTGLMGNLGYGRGYQYAHDAPDAQVSQEHLPDALRGRVYYQPTDRGAEKEIAERLAKWRAWREKQKRGDGRPWARSSPGKPWSDTTESWRKSPGSCGWAWSSAAARASTRSPWPAPPR